MTKFLKILRFSTFKPNIALYNLSIFFKTSSHTYINFNKN